MKSAWPPEVLKPLLAPIEDRNSPLRGSTQ